MAIGVEISLAAPAIAAPTAPACGSVTGYAPAPDPEGPFGISRGPEGMWYANGDYVVQVVNGQQHAFHVAPHAGVGWLALPLGSSSLWFAERTNGRLGAIDGNGHVVAYQIPNGPNGTAVPQSLVVGPGRSVWFTDQVNNRIGMLNTGTGQFAFYTDPGLQDPLGMTRGPDGALYFTERAVDQIGRMTPDGRFTYWSLTPGSFPNRIVVGPDGNIWFTELYGEKLGRIDAAGNLTEFTMFGGPVGITVGIDNQLYVALYQAHKVVRVGTNGAVERRWAVTGALQVGAGSRGTIWATDPFTNSVSAVQVDCT